MTDVEVVKGGLRKTRAGKNQVEGFRAGREEQ
jgi:hypothetical protein